MRPGPGRMGALNARPGYSWMLAALRTLSRVPRAKAAQWRAIGSSTRPELPIPALEDTLDRFLATVDPLLTGSERAEAGRVVEHFRSGEGPELQRLLAEYASEPEYLPDRRYMRGSYLEAFWDDMYLSPRGPVVVHSNPFLMFEPDAVKQRRTQARRAASLLYNSVLTLQLIEADGLELGNECPSQYWQLFRSTRVPQLKRDAIWTARDTTHVTVIHKGRFFALPVLTEAGEPMPEAHIADALERLLRDAEALPAPETDLSTLTQLPRDDWARLYSALRDTSAENRRAIDSIGSSVLHLVLEDRAPATETDRCSLMLHGSGRGRWHDKSVSLVVFPDGDAGLSFEHSWGDGQTLLRWANDISGGPGGDTVPHELAPSLASTRVEAEPLSVEVGPYVSAGIERAGRFAEELAASVAMDARRFGGLGKRVIKASGLSPDATVQVAYQRAYRRLFGAPASTYESCSTKHYRHGRTEAIRPCTHEAQAFAQASVDDPNAADLLRQAVEAHVDVARRCQRGEGVDRHLFALATTAAKHGRPHHELFSSAAYAKLKYDYMSTSNCSSELLKWFGFGPTTPDCCGIGYMIYEDGVSFTVSRWGEGAALMADAVQDSMRDIETIIKRMQ